MAGVVGPLGAASAGVEAAAAWKRRGASVSVTIIRAGSKLVGIGGAPSGLRFVHGMGGGAGNGLLNALIAYWPGNEANGNALDLHTNALHLTDVNTVTSNPGLVYALSRQYTAANSEYHTRPGDDALLSAGDNDFTIASWVRFDSIGAFRSIVSKYLGPGNYEYYLILSSLNRFRFVTSHDGTNISQVNANTFGAPIINTWYLAVAWHDSVANTINIQINNGAVDSLPHATGVFDGNTPFRLAQTAGALYMDGRIGPTMFWKSAGGGGGVLSVEQKTALYNAGAGLPYASFTA